MTDSIESSEPVEQFHGIVEAFLDGEAVDSSMLRSALADRTARDHFIDLLVIRGAVNQPDSVAMRSTRRPQSSRGRGPWLAAAAAGVVVSLSVGYVAGQRVIAESAAPSSVEAIVIVDAVPPAPEPTRSITLQPGINWTDSSGGR